MEVCHNCKNKPAEYICDICRRSYCEQCDLYIHSFSSKNNHIRKNIFQKSYQIDNVKNKYTTDKNGFYIYTGNLNYPIYKNKKNPLFEETKEEIVVKNNKNNNNYKNIKVSLADETDRVLYPQKLDYIKKTYNLENEENNKNSKLSMSSNKLSIDETLNETNPSYLKKK